MVPYNFDNLCRKIILGWGERMAYYKFYSLITIALLHLSTVEVDTRLPPLLSIGNIYAAYRYLSHLNTYKHYLDTKSSSAAELKQTIKCTQKNKRVRERRSRTRKGEETQFFRWTAATQVTRNIFRIWKPKDISFEMIQTAF